MSNTPLSRRGLILSGLAAGLCAPAVHAQSSEGTLTSGVRRNASSFAAQDWRNHFDALDRASIVCDTVSRALHFWNADGSDYRVYPTSVPKSDELTRRGYTTVVRKKIGPDWTPTPSMLEDNPDLEYMPPGPGNPLGTHAMYLAWPAYLIHGTHDTRKIGRRSSSGCIGLYNNMIAELFELTPIGAQVRVI